MANLEPNAHNPSEHPTQVQRIGLLGGSFDPIHLAHIQLACHARDQFGLDRVELIPAAQPWQRSTLKADAHHRLAMAKLAIADHAKLSINPIEINRGGPTYTIDTILALEPENRYYWILGADQLTNFCTWQQWQTIASRVTLLVAQRPSHFAQKSAQAAGSHDSSGHASLTLPEALLTQVKLGAAHVQALRFDPIDLSSSDIRERLAQARPVDHLLDPSVLRYIQDNHLYSASPETTL